MRVITLSDNNQDRSPTVSIIINCLNGERHVKETLDSVFGQTFDDWEIVFWDNASSDRSAEIAQSYGPKVKYFRSESTVDLGIARSWAFDKTNGKYVAILDADDIWDPRKLEYQIDLFEKNPELGLVYCDSFLFDGTGDKYKLFDTTKPKRGYVLGDLLAANFIFTSTMLYRRSVLDQLDCVFDQRYARIQDYDLSLKVAYHSQVDYVDLPLSRFRMYQDDPKWWKWKNSLGSRAAEAKKAVYNLIDSYPDIEETYERDLISFNKNSDYGFAMDSWQEGHTNKARRYLLQHFKDKKYAFVFLCTLMLRYDHFIRLKTIYRNQTRGRFSKS